MDRQQYQTIESELFTAAAGLLSGERGALSPLDEFNGKHSTQKTLQMLKKKGLLTSSGNVEPAFEGLLQALLNPVQEFRFDILNDEKESSFSVYFNDSTRPPTSLRASGDRLAITGDAAFPELIAEIEPYFSIKKSLKSVFTMEFSLEHAWTLACLLDLSRQNRVGVKTSGSISAAEIIQALEEFDNSSAWLWLNT